jgi:hypothetical protein
MEKGLDNLERHHDPSNFYVKPIQMDVIRISSIIVEEGI